MADLLSKINDADPRSQEILRHLKDPEWRLNNLYYIKDEHGHKVKFKFRPAQKELFDNMWYFNIIPKARQLGMTTFFCILYFDKILFSENQTAGIIAHKQEDMKKIFRNKIKFAWEHLPTWLREAIGEPVNDSANELVFPNGSTIFVALSTRSGTVQMLHISEFGYVCAKSPDKAEEIVTGAINSAHPGAMVSIESTARGRDGYFYNFSMEAEQNRILGKVLNKQEFKMFFFPWWIDARYVLDDPEITQTEDDKEYFKQVERDNDTKLSVGQRAWYINKRKLNLEKMTEEYPSSLEEAFSVSIEGAYYAKQMKQFYKDRRSTDVPYDSTRLVDTYWDIGMNDLTVILFVQTVGPSIRIIDVHADHSKGLEDYMKVLEDKGYRYRNHIFPHDIEVRDMSTGMSRKHKLYELGMKNIYVTKKMKILDGIERVRGIFSRFYIDQTKGAELITALQNYRRDWDKKFSTWKDKPFHDNNSHYADAVRVMALHWREEDWDTGYDPLDPDQRHGRGIPQDKTQSFF